ncbi:DnaB-like helicase C-terminal domain-containing protein [Nonomuraea zeae]|uniref:DnaB-like helicase C-terminal domain-containing protein n=1 Tax=Nonomuraea zeae TaxID=1642303 RepID=UPI00361C6887
MFLITRARARARSAGQPIPTVFQTLAHAGVHFRRSQLCLIAAAPGGGKSALASTVLLQSGADGIYFSADSDESEQYSRCVSILSGRPLTEVLEAMESGETEEFDDELEQLSRIRFDFNSAPSLDDIENGVTAYAHLYSRYPAVIIVDNLRDVVSDEMGEAYMVAENILAWLKDLARHTRACVIVLAHVTGEWEDGERPIPLSGLRGKVGKIPQVVLTLYGEMGVAIVKNRGGPASPAGRYTVELDCDLSTMTIKDHDQAPADLRRVYEEM